MKEWSLKMSGCSNFVIVTPDGSRVIVALPSSTAYLNCEPAPGWLVIRLGLPINSGQRWRLLPVDSGEEAKAQGQTQSTCSARKLCIVRSFVAAASKIPFDPRQARLKTERQRLEKLNKESDYVRVEPLNVLPGSEPEHYRVTFLCRGVIAIDAARNPIYGEKHQVEIFCDDEFPSDVPRLRWITPVWHPNIQHEEPKGVCVNKAEWLGGMGLDDLCRLMFEMIQYKNYHAQFTRPYPLDNEVARWVLEYAEPRNVVNKARGLSVDNKPFTRPTVTERISVGPAPSGTPPRIKLVSPAPAPSRIKIVSSSASKEREETGTVVSSSRIKILKKE